jgi:hypothetical protein
MLQLGDQIVFVGNLCFDQITDGDHPDQLFILEYWQVAAAFVGHHCQPFNNTHVGGDVKDFGSHDLFDKRFKR